MFGRRVPEPVPEDVFTLLYGASPWLGQVLGAFTLWASLYWLVHLAHGRRSVEWSCRLVTVLHAVLITSMAGWAGFVEGPWPFTDPAGPNTRLQHWTCVLTLGYFLFDFLWCVCFNNEGPIMLFHHALSIFGNGLVLHRGRNATEMMAALFGTEISNPLLQLRWFLRQAAPLPRKNTALSVTVDLLFVALFTVMRIGVGTALLVAYLMHPAPDAVVRYGAVAIYVVGWVFWFQVIRYVFRKYGHYLGLWPERKEVVVVSLAPSEAVAAAPTSKQTRTGFDTASRDQGAEQKESRERRERVESGGATTAAMAAQGHTRSHLHRSDSDAAPARGVIVVKDGVSLASPRRHHATSRSEEKVVFHESVAHEVNGILRHRPEATSGGV